MARLFAGWLLGPLVLLWAQQAQAAEVVTSLTVADTLLALDGFERLTLTVNGTSPGPVIRATKGDRVRVSVTNGLSSEEGLTTHWHGIYQRGTPWSDGTPDTQCPSMPEQTFDYEFDLGDQKGTHLYHSHSGPMHHTDGVYGAFIIKDPNPPFAYDEDSVLVLSDWWHEEGRKAVTGLMMKGNDFKWVNDPQSVLINGKANINCGPGNFTTCVGLERIHVKRDKTTYLHIVGGQSLDMMDVAIEGHDMEVVEADGHYVKPFNTSHVYVNAGERYGVLLRRKPDAKGSQFWIQVETRFRAQVNGTAVLVYDGAEGPTEGNTHGLMPANEPGKHPGQWPKSIMDQDARLANFPKEDKTNDTFIEHKKKMDTEASALAVEWTKQLKAHESETKGPWGSATGPIVPATLFLEIMGTQCRASRDGAEVFYAPYPANSNLSNPDTKTRVGYLKWCVNAEANRGTGPGLPMLIAAKSGKLKGQHARYIPIDKGAVVDVVVSNGWALNGVEEQHPWHLHGHSFWVLGYGNGTYNPQESWKGLNFVDPPVRDTFTLFPFHWTVIRFVADNPGVWQLHCHIASHLVMGMTVFFVERESEIPGPPAKTPMCGLSSDETASIFKNAHHNAKTRYLRQSA